MTIKNNYILPVFILLLFLCAYYGKDNNYYIADGYKGKSIELNSLGLANLIPAKSLPDKTYKKLLSEIQIRIEMECQRTINFKIISISDSLIDKTHRIPTKNNLVFGNFKPNILLFIKSIYFEYSKPIYSVDYNKKASISCEIDFTFWNNNNGNVIYSGKALGEEEASDYSPFKKLSASFCEEDTILVFFNALTNMMQKSPFIIDPFENIENRFMDLGK